MKGYRFKVFTLDNNEQNKTREREHNNRSVTELNYQREEKHLFRRIIVEKAFYHEKLIKFSGGKRNVYQSMKVLPLRVKYLGQLRPKFPPRREGEVETVCHYEKQFHANVITTTQTSRLLAERAMYFRILMRGSSSIPIARLPGVAISPKPNSLFKFVKHPLTMMLINQRVTRCIWKLYMLEIFQFFFGESLSLKVSMKSCKN